MSPCRCWRPVARRVSSTDGLLTSGNLEGISALRSHKCRKMKMGVKNVFIMETGSGKLQKPLPNKIGASCRILFDLEGGVGLQTPLLP